MVFETADFKFLKIIHASIGKPPRLDSVDICVWEQFRALADFVEYMRMCSRYAQQEGDSTSESIIYKSIFHLRHIR